MTWSSGAVQDDAVRQTCKCGVEHTATAEEVLAFWRAAGPEKWFEKDAAFDQEIATRFGDVWEAAAAGKLAGWEALPQSALALVIVLDQFTRNMFRGQRRCYDCDALARAVAQRALARRFDQKVAYADRQFLYLPFMHSEDLSDQERCLDLARAYGDEEFTRFADQHAGLIRRFGRFPHRNRVLGRATTPDEQAFLDAGGFAG
jgi:uncharacterized protein (DUF924 family)